MTSKRLLKELNELMNDYNVQSYFHYENMEIDEISKEPIIYGYLLPSIIPYKYGAYKISIRIPQYYPLSAPELQLLTFIYHPGVTNNVQNPSFCRQCCKETWSPALPLSKYIWMHVNAINATVFHEGGCTLNTEAVSMMKKNIEVYKQKVLEMVQKYSLPRPMRLVPPLKFLVKQHIRGKFRIDQLSISNQLKEYLKR